MTDRMVDVVFFGATGYTGSLAVRAAAKRGLSLGIAGRNLPRLEVLASELSSKPLIARADVDDLGSLRRMAAQGKVLCSTVGPFSELGGPVVEACILEGTHYIDTTGEQSWVANLLDFIDRRAETRGVTLCPSMAFEIAIADTAAFLAAKGIAQLKDIRIVYSIRGLGTSRGTRLTMLSSLASRGCQWEQGRRESRSAGSGVIRALLPGSEDARILVMLPTPEVLTVPRHTVTPCVRTYVTLPSWASLAPLAVEPLLRTLGRAPLRSLLSLFARWGPLGPSEGRRKKAHAQILATARDFDGRARTVTVELPDPYGITGEIVVTGAQSLLRGSGRPGFRAPAEVVGDPLHFLRSLVSSGLSLEVHAADLIREERE